MSEKANDGILEPYRSARELPSIREQEALLRSFEILTNFKNKEMRDQLRKSKADLEDIVRTVDGFYEVLGERNWVLHDRLNFGIARQVSDAKSIEAGERVLLDWYQSENSIKDLVRYISRSPGIQQRLTLLENALEGYKSRRFYSTTLTLLAVMDGFVNDIDPNEKGLHARQPEELVAWDSAVGHIMGLSHAHVSFREPVKKLRTHEVFDLNRNGIVHGMVVSFDNEVVATKAWNRLFSVVDWVRSIERRFSTPSNDPSFGQLLLNLRKNREVKAYLDAFRPYECRPGSATFNLDPAAFVAESFLRLWQSRQYNRMASFLS